MSKHILQDVGGINIGVRLRNPQFIIRLIASIVLPALAFVGFSVEDLTSWNLVGEALFELIKSPIAVGIIILNIANIIPDPTKTGFTDTELVKNRVNPKDSSDFNTEDIHESLEEFSYPEAVETDNEVLSKEEKLKK